MRIILKLLIIVTLTWHSVSIYGQEATDPDTLTLTIDLPKAVHFSDTEGNALLVPSGTYWVFPDENGLMLFGLEKSETFNLAVTAGDSDQEVSEAIATSVPGHEDEPDIHFIFYTSDSGIQLVAEGSYSGVKSRGWREKAKAARAAAAQRARQSALAQAAKKKALENDRLMQAARGVQTIIDRAKSYSQNEALTRAEYLLTDVAHTARQHGSQAALDKAKYYAAELAVLTAIIIPPSQRQELRRQTAIQIANNIDFLKEVNSRMLKSETITKHIGEKKGLVFTDDELDQIRVDIMGNASNPLSLPFVKPRGGYVSGPSVGIGANASAGAVVGVGVGTMLAGNLTRGFEFDPVGCALFWGQAGVGPQLFAGIGVDFGAFTTAADEMIGWSIPVMATGGALGDFSVTVFFSPERRADLSVPGLLTNVILAPARRFTGFVVSPGVGVGAGLSINLSYTVTTGCFTRDGITESPVEG